MKIGYVCTNYNNSQFTCEAVKSLSASAGHDIRIAVVDNNSNKESVEELSRLAACHSNLDLILNPDNLGYFRGLNVGIVRLRQHHPDLDVIVVGNNDLTFPEDFGDSLVRKQDRLREYAVIAPNIITLDGVHQNPHVVRKISKSRELIYDLYYSNYWLAQIIKKMAELSAALTDRDDEALHAVAQPIYQGHGACYVLTPLFFRFFTELWAPTFLMGEEFFLSKQLSDRGLQKFYEPSIVVRHHCHAAVAKIPSKEMWRISREAHNTYRKHVRIFN